MMTTIDSMQNAFPPESHIVYSETFIRQLVKTLKYGNSYLFPFNKLKEKINIIYADDNAFRIFNWEVDQSEIYMRYYGAIQMPGEKLKLYGLSDYSQELQKGGEDSVLTGRKWYGALYYNIISHDVQGQKVYTLFGYSGASPLSSKRLLDALIIDDNGITFGAPIFGIGSTNIPRQPVKRFILEYKKGVEVALKWDAERNMIVFDELVSQVNDPNRKYTFVPSGEYNGLYWDNGMWNLRRNIMPITELQDGQAPSEEPVKIK